jgi:hypothetical protein
MNSDKILLVKYLEEQGIETGKAHRMIYHPSTMSHEEWMMMAEFALKEMDKLGDSLKTSYSQPKH